MPLLGPLAAHLVEAVGEGAGSPVVLVHGFGQGAWIWERDQAVFAEAGFTTWAIELPGHGADAGSSVSLEELVASLAAAVATLETPVLVGLGGGALLAQVVAAREPVGPLVLVNPLPPAQVRFRPGRTGLRALVQAGPGLLTGRVRLPLDASVAASLAAVEPSERRSIWERITPWPPGLARDLLLRPEAPPAPGPTLVLPGLADHLVPTAVARLVGDYHQAVVWRFDDVGHLPPLEAAGLRLTRHLVDWLQRPHRRQVVELDAFAPDEGVGKRVRDARRGDRPRPRSNSRFLAHNRARSRKRRFRTPPEG